MPRVPQDLKDRMTGGNVGNVGNTGNDVNVDPVDNQTNTGVDNVNVDPAIVANPDAPHVDDANVVVPGTVNTIDVQAPGADTDSGIPDAQLNPTGKPVPLTTAMKAVVGRSDAKLDLDVINDTMNPHKAIVGDFTDPGQLFQGKAFIPTQKLIGGVAQAGGADLAALAPLLGALPEVSVYLSAAHQFAVDGANKPPGNRVVIYGGQTGHKDLDVVVNEAGKQGMRLLKVMAHVNAEGQGGAPDAIVEDGVAGVTHTGGLSSGWIGGEKCSIRSDWPSDYGTLDDGNVDYNAHLIAIDYQAGTKKNVPKRTLLAWKKNADVIDAFAGAIFPFASGDLDPRYTNYKFNPLDVHDADSAAQVLQDMATLDTDHALKEHGAFYCAEGQNSVASMGWQERCLVKEDDFADTPMGKAIAEFQKAPGLERNADGEITNPEVGWQHLEDKGLITAEQHQGAKATKRTAVALEFVPDDIEGVESYGCTNKDGMIAEPMSVATMAWGILRSYMPREGIAKQMAGDLMKAYKGGDAAVQGGLTALLGGKNPITAEGQQALGGLCMKAASGLLLSVLGSDKFRDKLLQKAGFNEITNDADKGKVMALYKEFTDALQNADLSDQGALDQALQDIDQKFKDLVVEREDFDPRTGQTTGVKKSVMKYAAPQCNMFWTQQPDVFEQTGALRYLVTAMHAEQAGQ